MPDIISKTMTGLVGATQASFFGLILMASLYLIIIAFIIALGMLVLWIITLIDCIRRKDEDFAIGGRNARLIWLLLLILIRNIVPLIYFILIMYKKPVAMSEK